MTDPFFYDYNLTPVSPAGSLNESGTVQITAPVGAARLQELLSGLQSGQTLHARILSLETDGAGNRYARMDLGENLSVTARCNGNLSLLEGSLLSFQVSKSGEGKISLHPLYQNTAALDQVVAKALQNAGMSTEEANVQMVRDMMEKGLPIDRSSLYQMKEAVNDFPFAPMQTLLQLKSMGIAVNADNIEQMMNYQTFQHQIVDSVGEIISEMPQAYLSLLQSGQAQQALDMYSTCIKMFVSQEAETEETAERSPGKVEKSTQISPELQEALPDEQGMELQKQPQDLLFAKESFLRLVKELGATPEELRQVFVKTQGGTAEAFSARQLLLLLDTLYDRTDQTKESKENWSRIFSSDVFTKAFRSEMERQWLLEPEKVNEASVNRLYERLQEQTQKLTQTLKDFAVKDTALAQSVNHLSQNVEFMNQVNHLFQYVQLPLKMQNGNANGELYIYTDKRALARKDGDVSALLHLDMEALGSLDVYVAMHGQKVNTNFYLENEDALQLMEAHLEELNARLLKRGYTMETRMQLMSERSKEDAAVSALLKNGARNQIGVDVLSSSRFDARA